MSKKKPKKTKDRPKTVLDPLGIGEYINRLKGPTLEVEAEIARRGREMDTEGEINIRLDMAENKPIEKPANLGKYIKRIKGQTLDVESILAGRKRGFGKYPDMMYDIRAIFDSIDFSSSIANKYDTKNVVISNSNIIFSTNSILQDSSFISSEVFLGHTFKTVKTIKDNIFYKCRVRLFIQDPYAEAAMYTKYFINNNILVSSALYIKSATKYGEDAMGCFYFGKEGRPYLLDKVNFESPGKPTKTLMIPSTTPYRVIYEKLDLSEEAKNRAKRKKWWHTNDKK